VPHSKKKKTKRSKTAPAPPQSRISALLREKRVFKPRAAFVRQANCNDPKIYQRAARGPEKFWHDWAQELEWIKPPKKVLEWKPPNAKWFIGGKLNLSVNCLDRHVKTAGHKVPPYTTAARLAWLV